MIDFLKKLFFVGVFLSFLAGLGFGVGCTSEGKGHMELGFRMNNEFTFFGRASEGGAHMELKSTMVDDVVGGLFGPPAPTPEP